MTWMRWFHAEASPAFEHLVNTLVEAHHRACLSNENASSHALRLAASVGVPFPQAVAAALLTLGGPHGPVTQARELLMDWSDEQIRASVDRGDKIPGFGNAFHKDRLDPAWAEMEALLWEFYPDHAKKLDLVASWIVARHAVRIFPNAAAFTAVVAEILGIPRGIEMVLPVMARLPAWGQQYLAQRNAR